MLSSPLDQQLRHRLSDIPEIAVSGFSVREGLTGAGVTVLKGRTYFGSWRLNAGALMWVSATSSDLNVRAASLEDAVRQTLLMILRSLQHSCTARPERALAG